MSQIIIYQNNSGIIQFVAPCGNNSYQDAINKSIPTGTPYWIVNKSEIPKSEKDFMNAWEIDTDGETPKIKINLDKAKEIQKEKLRRERSILFQDLDLQFMRKLENNEDTSEIVLEKNRIRNITNDPRFDTATTTQEIREITL